MKIAVTGGTGYLGAHTVKTLLEAGHSVRLLVAPGCGSEPVIPRLRELGALEVLDGDIRDADVVGRLLDGCDSVLHAAGVVGTNDRLEKLMWDINAYATEAILTRAVAAGLDPVVSVSSYSALFPPPDGVIGPDSPTVPGRSAYARTKAYGERVARRLQDEGEIRARIAESLAVVELSGTEAKYPAELSGGMRKRVGIARAIALRPRYILYDEPTTGLDPVTSAVMDQLMIRTRDLGVTGLVVTHDMRSAFTVGDRIAMLYEGAIRQVGSVAEIRATDDPVVRQFIEGRPGDPAAAGRTL
jgi:ABC-type dipeptide/oligopeptide/nickel transport system ATPase component